VAEGYRALESSDVRITEAGDTRITEQVTFGAISLSSSIGLTTQVTGSFGVATSVTSSLSVTVQASLTNRAVTSLLGSLTNTPTIVKQRLLDTNLTSTLSAGLTSTLRLRGASLVSASLSVAPTAFGSFSLGTGLTTALSLTPTPFKTIYADYTSADEEPTRFTEAGDTRITESGDTRILAQLGNVGVLSLVTLPDKILFNSLVYTKIAGTWTRIVPSANLEDDWSLTNKMYKNQSGKWARIY
jgi:hypothetical protein